LNDGVAGGRAVAINQIGKGLDSMTCTRIELSCLGRGALNIFSGNVRHWPAGDVKRFLVVESVLQMPHSCTKSPEITRLEQPRN